MPDSVGCTICKAGWSLPNPPKGFTTPVACYYDDGSVVLDWTREPERDFASEHDGKEVAIDWPFIDGVDHIVDGIPDKQLWKSVGILPLW